MKPNSASEGPILVHENVVLVEASSSEEALDKARKIGEMGATLDDGLTINGVPASRIFAGIRKVTTVSNPSPYNLDQDRPTDGTEITYSVFEVADEQILTALGSGDAVTIRYVE